MGAFEIVEIPASGAYGTVCVARPVNEPDRIVALKVLRVGLAGSDKAIGRARDEARMLYRLRHPDIVQVEALIEIGGRPVLVMEWVAGLSLATLLHHHRDGLPPVVACEIARRVAGALHAAWESPNGPDGAPMRIVHRDVKPANVLIGVDGRVKVVDFGIAHGEFSDRETTTITGVVGSQQYTAPERLETLEPTPAVDVYALGISLFELLTGRAPILPREVDRHANALERQLQYVLPESAVEPELRDEIRGLIRKMAARLPEYRPSALEVAANLQLLVRQLGGVDLRTFADEHVRPLHDGRPHVDPRVHPDYGEVRFLEEDDRPREDTALEPVADDQDRAVQRADRRVRRFLARPDWHDQIRELRWLLATNQAWSPDPFVEILEKAVRPWWRFWAPTAPTPQVVAALEILRHRPTDAVRQLAGRFSSHADPAVASAARALLEKPR